jgi:SOS-response transcriptional repressor LexA
MAKVDPTKNVVELVKAQAKRLDQKIKANERHAQQLREAESKRIDANRAGDQQAIQVQQGTFTDLANRMAAIERIQAANSGRMSVTSIVITIVTAIAAAVIGYFAKR